MKTQTTRLRKKIKSQFKEEYLNHYKTFIKVANINSHK